MQHVAGPLQRLRSDILRALPAEAAAQEAWSLVSGPAVAPKTKVVALTAGVLTIQVLSREWRDGLSRLESAYVAKVNEYLGEKIVSIRFVTDP
jgi:hypothetical protein